jgi:hypothetical protein
MTKKTTQKPRPPNYHLTLHFEHQARRLPPADRPTLLTHLRRLRHRHPHRTFYLIDELGRRHRL